MPTQLEPFHKLLLQHLQEGVCFIDAALNITLWNNAAEQLTGFAAEELLGIPYHESPLKLSMSVHNANDDALFPHDRSNGDLTPRVHRLFFQHKQGHRILIHLKTIPVEDSSGTLGLISDASHLAELEATTRSMQKLMRIDPMTQLPNKRSLFDSMKGEYLRFARYGTPFALIAISIDPPQDEALTRMGPGRDALLKWFAQQLSLGFRKADTVGRLRGASFLVLLPHSNTQAAEKAAEKIRSMLARTPYPENGVPITASFGCASISRSDTLDRLIERAKKALKVVRGDQGNHVASL